MNTSENDARAEQSALRGRLESAPRFYRDGFLIGDLTTEQGESVTVKGAIQEACFGETYELHGAWQTHPKHGRQFAFEAYRLDMPSSDEGLRRFLVRQFKGVGPAAAARVVDVFGSEALQVMRDDPERVSREARIPYDRAREFGAWLREHVDQAEARAQLETLFAGTPATARAIHAAIEKWGADAPGVVRQSPYRLMELPGIGFRTADQIARARLGLAADALERRAHAVVYAMREEAAANGHTVCDRMRLDGLVAKLIGLPPGDDALQECEQLGGVVADWDDAAQPSQLSDLYTAEQTIAARLATLQSYPADALQVESDDLAADQRAAVETIRTSRVAILTGAPGTGKTYTVARIVATAIRAGLVPALAAPTGKAAKVMTEAFAAAGVPAAASTIHALLRAVPDGDRWHYGANRQSPLGANTLLVLDESSMVDTTLMAAVLAALHDDSRVLFVGDTNQLPSVGPGAVLRDMIAAGVPHVELHEIKRNAGDLLRAVHAVIGGDEPAWSPTFDLDSGRNLRFVEQPDDAIEPTMMALLQRLEARGYDPTWDVQVIVPTNERGLGCKDLNESLRAALSTSPKVGRSPWRVGDKVVQTKNQAVRGRYERREDGVAESDGQNVALGEVRVVNGDLGCVEMVTSDVIRVRHWTPERVVEYPTKPSEHRLRHAYALTCHKMQGSSAPVVILPMHSSYRGPIWTREWLYTALSRGEQAAIVVGSREVFRYALRRPARDQRRTRLVETIEMLRQQTGAPAGQAGAA